MLRQSQRERNRGAAPPIVVRPVTGRAERDHFIELAYAINADTPNWVPPLRVDVRELLNPAKNPFFEHATVQLFLARRGETPVGRIAAHLDQLALAQPADQGMGPGVGHWGLFEARDEETAHALLAAAEQWLRERGMTRALGPISLSVWDEPGLLTFGHDHAPTIMMGHHRAEYAGWIEAAGHAPVKQLFTYEVPVADGFPPLFRRIVASGERNPRITIRPMDMKRFDEDAQTMLGILNEAWSGNWGFVPLTAAEIAYAARKFKPIIMEGLIQIADYDGQPAAFMIAFPDVNEAIAPLNGNLFPFGWARLLWSLKRKRWRGFRVPLMGVVRKHQNSRLASQLAFMMIERIRERGVNDYGARRAEVGWVLDDNAGMNAIADAIEGRRNREYTIFGKGL